MIDQALETLIAHADPSLTQAWARFVREQDLRYARLARESGRPYSPFAEDEVYEAATLAAALGVEPASAPRQAAGERELVAAR
jgi:hypothetical protein